MSDTPQTFPRSLGMLALAAVMTAVTSLLAWCMPPLLASFRKFFDDFRVPVSGATKFAMETGHAWWVFAIAFLAIFIWVAVRAHPSVVEYRRMKIALRAVITLGVLAYAAAAVAIYSQSYKLAGVV